MATIILSLLTYKKDFEYNKFTSFLELHANINLHYKKELFL